MAYLEENLMGGDNKSKSKLTSSDEVSPDNDKAENKPKSNEDNDDQVKI